MYTLIITRDDAKVDEITVEQQSLRIGRTSDNDIHIAEPTVSAHHAEIIADGGYWYVLDLRSTNGTFVNGKRIVRHLLDHGDIIVIGRHKLIYEASTSDRLRRKELTLELSRNELDALLAGARSNDPQPPARINWVAQDERGMWWGFERKPIQTEHGWETGGSGRTVQLKRGTTTPEWSETLRKV